MRKIVWLILLLTAACFAAEDMYQFSSPAQQQQFTTLTTELRCLVCQNENLAESNSALANDLRDKIYQRIKAGENNQQIIQYMVARYGNYILYRPPFTLSTIGLWLAPFILLIIGLGYLFYYLYKHREK